LSNDEELRQNLIWTVITAELGLDHIRGSWYVIRNNRDLLRAVNKELACVGFRKATQAEVDTLTLWAHRIAGPKTNH
jgi:hypothetical protein